MYRCVILKQFETQLLIFQPDQGKTLLLANAKIYKNTSKCLDLQKCPPATIPLTSTEQIKYSKCNLELLQTIGSSESEIINEEKHIFLPWTYSQ